MLNFSIIAKSCAVVSLAACTLAAIVVTASGQTTIRLLGASTGVGSGIVALANKFNNEQKEIYVEVVRVPPADTYMQTLLTQLQSGGGPDLIMLSNGRGTPDGAQRLGASGQLADLSEESWAKTYPVGLVGGFKNEGKLFGLPLAFTTVGMIYNVDLFKRHNLDPPTTFNDLLALCDAANAIGKRAIAVNGQAPWYFLQAVAVSTNYTYEPNWDQQKTEGKSTFSGSKGWKEALEFVQTMIDKNCFQQGVQAEASAQVFAQLAGERVFASVSPAPLIGSVKEIRPDINLKMLPFPAKTAEDRLLIAFLNDGIGVRSNSKFKKEAMRFLEYVGRPENLQEYIKIAGGISPYALETGKFGEEMSDIAPFIASKRIFEVPHVSWRSLAPRNVLSVDGSALLARSIKVDQFLKDMDSSW